MPAPFVKKVLGGDEDAWSKAKASAEKSGHAEDWAYIAGVAKKIHRNKGEDVEKPEEPTITDDVTDGPVDFLGKPGFAPIKVESLTNQITRELTEAAFYLHVTRRCTTTRARGSFQPGTAGST